MDEHERVDKIVYVLGYEGRIAAESTDFCLVSGSLQAHLVISNASSRLTIPRMSDEVSGMDANDSAVLVKADAYLARSCYLADSLLYHVAEEPKVRPVSRFLGPRTRARSTNKSANFCVDPVMSPDMSVNVAMLLRVRMVDG